MGKRVSCWLSSPAHVTLPPPRTKERELVELSLWWKRPDSKPVELHADHFMSHCFSNVSLHVDKEKAAWKHYWGTNVHVSNCAFKYTVHPTLMYFSPWGKKHNKIYVFKNLQYSDTSKQTHLSPAFPTEKEQSRLPHSLFNLTFFSMSYVTY